MWAVARGEMVPPCPELPVWNINLAVGSIQTLLIARKSVHADAQRPRMRKRSPLALNCCTVTL